MSNKEVDVVIVGGGWVGGIMGAELTKAGMTVVCLERGADNRDTQQWAKPGMHDELRYAIRLGLMQDTSRETWTMRHNLNESATPIRYLASFLPGTGVGGAGIHWNGQTWRFNARDFTIRSHTEQRYGAASIPADVSIQDWGITYDELEPYYDRFEYMAGIAGRAGNVQGRIQHGGNPFESPRSRDYPVPPMKTPHAPGVFRPGRGEARLQAVPDAERELAVAVHEPGRDQPGHVHVLRLLRAVRVRGRREIGPDRHRAAGGGEDGPLRDAGPEQRVSSTTGRRPRA